MFRNVGVLPAIGFLRARHDSLSGELDQVETLVGTGSC